MLRIRIRARWAAVTAVGLAVALFAAGGIGLAGSPGNSPAPGAAAAATDLRGIAGLQLQLRHEPRDWRSWAALGLSYVDTARTTLDPALYPKADQALRRSLQLQPADNDRAAAGLGALAAARHDFAAARGWARRALAVNGYSATALAVLADAETELGNYPAGLTAAHRLDDVQPGVASFSRLSYQAELHGNTAEAVRLLQLALPAASTPADTAFVRYHLGELYRQQGALPAAAHEYDLGVRARPGDPACTVGQARIAVASGHTDAALASYRSVVATVPTPQYVAELGDLLAALHRAPEAAQQYAVVRAEDRIARSGGVDADLELALFDADHTADRGAAAGALSAATATWRRRHSVQAADAMAWALHANGQDAAAIGYADAALRLGTRSAAFHYHRGVIDAALGRRAAARAELSRALAMDPHFSVLGAARARTLLGSLL